MSDVSAPLAEIADEAHRILAAAEQADVQLRLIGGLAVLFHSDPLHPALERPYKDIDLATVKGQSRKVGDLMASLGYQPAKEFNALNGNRRLLFYDVPNERQVDVFVGTFEMCHVIPISDRIAIEEKTIPLAELLLTKMQVVELNEKDLTDIVALLHHHDVADHDDDAVNAEEVARLTADDWGLWRTTQMNIDRVRERAGTVGLSDEEHRQVMERLDALAAAIDAAPKSRGWRLRDRIGDRKRWYENPDEVA
jgi:hypothetical protein